MKHWLLGFTFMLLVTLTGVSEEPLKLAENGETRYVILEGGNATEPEKYAAKELAEFLKRATGAEFPVVVESAESADSGEVPKIYVGWTEFAAKNGVEPFKLGEEEWLIRTVGHNLIITGGRPRGTMYGVYEFLEDHVGCHWLDRGTEVVPNKPTLEMGSLDIQAKPWFWYRRLYALVPTPDDKWNFMIRNKNYRYDFRGRRDFSPKDAFYKLQGAPGGIHSFSNFVNAKDWYDSHPEYFSLVNGKRLPAYDGGGPGQLCLTNPDVRRITLEKLREFIKRDREEAKRKGCLPPKIYGINQNDRYNAHCQCKNCQAIAKKEGGESGPLLDFINFVAEDIEEDYPDILIYTIAYNLTATPPKSIKPRNNVIVGWCDVYSKCDGIRPLKHPYNCGNYKEITSWGKIVPRMAIA